MLNIRFSRKLTSLLFGKTIYQRIFRLYVIVILIGSGLLFAPFSLQNGKLTHFWDAIFTATSAFTNTGLSSHVTKDTFTFVGQLIILLLIQFGGIGFLTILIYFWAWVSRGGSLSVQQRLFLHCERGSYHQSESLPTVRTGIIVVLFTEFIGAILLTIFFYCAKPSDNGTNGLQWSFWKSLWAGIFHSVSAANNAGFDILGSKSIIPYRNDANNILSVILLLESIIGGIGYPVFHDIYMYLKSKKRCERWRLSLFTKICVVAYISLFFLGSSLAIGFETLFGTLLSSTTNGGSNCWGTYSTANKVWNIMYLTFSSRSSGFASIEIKELSEATKWLLSILMFIGASPASTGGGIRTITVFIIVSRIIYTAFGRKNLSAFGKNIDQNIVLESCNVFILSIILLAFSVCCLSVGKKSFKLGDIIFEVSSAFGTAGLTTGLSSQTSFWKKGILMLLMFVGQLGVSNSFLLIDNKANNRRYCSESLRII